MPAKRPDSAPRSLPIFPPLSSFSTLQALAVDIGKAPHSAADRVRRPQTDRLDASEGHVETAPEAMENASTPQEALRVQVAAVAAQQAALTEQESRLQQRQAALEQQEAQLAAHLEEKRRRLLELREELRQAHARLKSERAAHEAEARERLAALETAHQEAADAQQQAQAERQRLVSLRVRLKRRWHRHWAAERAATRQREPALVRSQRNLESEADRAQRERAQLEQAFAQFQAETELGRRQLQVAWDALRAEQRQWCKERDERNAALDRRTTRCAQREKAALEIERGLAARQQQWERVRLAREKETDGLENRIRNQRRKLLDQEQEAARLEAVIRALSGRVERKSHDARQAAEQPSAVAVPFALPVTPGSVPLPDTATQTCDAAV